MKIVDPLQMSDWPIKKLVIIVFTFQLLLWGSIGLDTINFRIPLLRQFVCFIYLTFVPGILILRVFRLRKLGSVKNMLCSVGLSLSFLMFIGFFMNTFYPLIGISKPISIIPLTLTVSFIVLLLCYLCYLIDRNFSDPSYLNISEVLSSPSLFLYLIPMLTIIGTYLMNFYNNNFLLMIVIFLISLIPVFVLFSLIPPRLYPLAIFIASLSLLFHNSLISMYISGWDIQDEYYLANKVITNYLWNTSIFSNTNAMLSIVILAPIYSIISNLDLNWVFKIIYPVIFSFTPLGLYLFFKKQTTEKIAFMAAFFFISFAGFYTEMLQLARQQIAEYFFILAMLLIVENKNDIFNRFLLVLFSLSVIISHYGLSYLALAAIVFSFLLLSIYKKYFDRSSLNAITFTFTLLFTVFLLTWYIYVSSSSSFYTVVNISKNIIENFISDFSNPDKAQGLYIISKKADTDLHQLSKAMHIITQILISVGLIHMVVYIIRKNPKKHLKINNEFLSFCIVFYLMLVASIVVPNFSSALNTSRIYQITLMTLAPCCIIGGVVLLGTIFNWILRSKVKEKNMLALKVLSVFFAIFLLFNTGWIYEIVGDSPTSFSLNNTLDYPMFNDRDVAGKEWLYQVSRIEENKGYIYADSYRWLLLLSCLGRNNLGTFPESFDQIPENSYIYISTYNTVKNEILIFRQMGTIGFSEYVNFDSYLSSKNKIYNNGGAKIYC